MSGAPRQERAALQDGLMRAALAFHTRVRAGATPMPAAQGGRRQSCHPLVTTEADLQRWFGTALEGAFPTHVVHAEVHAVTSLESGRTLRTDLTLHRSRSAPFLHDEDLTQRDVELCLELKVLRVGAADRHWQDEALMSERVDALLHAVDGDLAKGARGAFDVLGVVFVEPLAYRRSRDEAERIAGLLAERAAGRGLHLLHPFRNDETPGCLVYLSRHPFTETP